MINFSLGVHVVDQTQDSFRQRIIIEKTLIQRNAVIEIDFTSVKMLVTLSVDTANTTTVTTTLLHGDVQNEVSSAEDSCLPRPKTRSEKPRHSKKGTSNKQQT